MPLTFIKNAIVTFAAASSLVTTSLPAQQIGFVDRPLTSIRAQPGFITQGSDGALWFTESGTNKIGRMTVAGVLSEYSIPTTNAGPLGITNGPDGAIWFTESSLTVSKIGRVTTAGVFTEFPLPGPDPQPGSITSGPDGALWFTEFVGDAIGRITTAGAITGYPLPPGPSAPDGITVGPDGALWFTAIQGNYIGRITTAGAISEFVVPNPGGGPFEITSGPDGALWFTEDGPNIGRVTTDGAFSEYPLPIATTLAADITTGSDGALWFTDLTNQEIGRITTDGVITEYPLPVHDAGPDGITLGPNSRLWFTETSSPRIGQVIPTTALLSSAQKSGHAGSKPSLTGTGFGVTETVNVYWDSTSGDLLTSVSTDGDGSFTVNPPVPPEPYGNSSFVAVGQTSGKIAVANFDLIGFLVPTPDVGAPGSSITLDGYGFGASGMVDCFWDAITLLDSATSNVRGTFTFTFSIPADSPEGANILSCQELGMPPATTTVTVQ